MQKRRAFSPHFIRTIRQLNDIVAYCSIEQLKLQGFFTGKQKQKNLLFFIIQDIQIKNEIKMNLHCALQLEKATFEGNAFYHTFKSSASSAHYSGQAPATCFHQLPPTPGCLMLAAFTKCNNLQ
ncbi:uncharacterized protein V6R79_004529 [Siganus canaliculatus]